MSKKIVIRADLICEKSKSEMLSAVAKLKGIKSMDMDHEKNTLTVVGAVDPVRVVQRLRKACFAATIVSVEDDKPKPKKTPCQEACEKACKDKCEKLCKTCEKACKDKCEKDCKEKCDNCEKACKEACCDKGPWYGYGYRCTPGCYSSPCGLPSCHYYSNGYGYGYGEPVLPPGYGYYGRPC
uniref:Uncharacterized protein n=1 Tax=Avena sativa TaxID=4498 RepID=A0ACD5VSL1_AVESA